MKNKIYNFLMLKYKNILHKIKVRLYHFYSYYEEAKNTNYFGKAIFFKLCKTLAIIIPTVLVIQYIDNIMLPYFKEVKIIVDNSQVSNVILAGIGMAGVFLALHCTNISSIYSAKYSNAPDSIVKLFENDILTNTSINSIIDYMIFSLMLLFVILLKQYVGVIAILIFFVFSIWIIISYVLIGNKRHRIADTYGIASSLYSDIIKMINYASSDRSIFQYNALQHHYKEVCTKKLLTLKDIVEFNLQGNSNNIFAMARMMVINNELLSIYWKNKKTIPYKSFWYREKYNYSKWHFANDSETSRAIKTGGIIDSKKDIDTYWFENELFNINNIMFDELIKSKDWKNIYLYCSSLKELSINAASSQSLKQHFKYIEDYSNRILKLCIAEFKKEGSEEQQENIIGSIDCILVIYAYTIIAVRQQIESINWDELAKYSLQVRKYSEINYCTNKFLNNSRAESLYNGIELEYSVEQKRITGDWYIEQVLAHNIYEELESSINILDKIYNELFLKMLKSLSEEKVYLGAMLIPLRMEEMKVKIDAFLPKLEEFIGFLKSKHVETSVTWVESTVDSFKSNMEKNYSDIPTYWTESTIEYYSVNSDDYDKYPDMLGTCYNYLCNHLINDIVNIDIESFAKNYKNFLRITILYQEYIRKDTIHIKEIHKQEFALRSWTKPFMIYSEISGYAYLWGELVDHDWRKIVEETLADSVKRLDSKSEKFYSSWISLCSIKQYGTLLTEWKRKIEATIRANKLLKYKQSSMLGMETLDTDSKLIKCFFGNRPGYIMCSKKAYEVFLTLCVNKYVPADKRFVSNFKWEEDLNEE